MGARLSQLCFGLIPDGPFDRLPVTELQEYDWALLAALRRSGRLLVLVFLWNVGDDALSCALVRDPLGLVAGLAGSLPMLPQARDAAHREGGRRGVDADVQRAPARAHVLDRQRREAVRRGLQPRARASSRTARRARGRPPDAASCSAPLFLVQVIAFPVRGRLGRTDSAVADLSGDGARPRSSAMAAVQASGSPRRQPRGRERLRRRFGAAERAGSEAPASPWAVPPNRR